MIKEHFYIAYTNETRQKLDAILKAFEGYIDSQDYFDIVYSKKAGYLYFVVNTPEEAGPELLDTPEKMLDVLFNEIINDVINSPENTTHISDARTLTAWEEAESRRQLTAILEQIADGSDTYLKFLDCDMNPYEAANAPVGTSEKVL